MEDTKKRHVSAQEIDEHLSLQDYIKACLRNWPWLIFSVLVCVGLGVIYIKCQEPVYERTEEILIKDQEAGGGVGGMSSAFASMGLVSGKTNVFNELISITSPAILAEVIDRLALDIDYVQSGSFHGTTLYGTTLPFKIKFLDLAPQQSAELKCEISATGTIKLYQFLSFTQDGEKRKYPEELDSVKIGSIVKTPLGNIQLIANDDYVDSSVAPNNKKSLEISISKMDFQTALETYQKKIQGDLKDEYADVITLTMRDVSTQRAVDVLNEILYVYNENWVEDKNKIAKATSEFINDRLNIIEQELGDVDSKIAEHRSSTTGAVGVIEKATALMEKESTLGNRIVDINNKLSLCRYLLEYLKDSNNQYNIIPNNTGAQSVEVEAQINTYNELLLSRNSLEQSSSTNNPLVKDYDTQLMNLRKAILKGMDNRITELETLLSSATKEQLKTQSSIKETPIQSLPLLSEQRQQLVKQNLYLYLLEKREENELSQKFTADNTRVITPPMGSLKPVAPKKKIILLFVFVLGLAIPMLYIYIIKTSDSKIRAKKDLEKVRIPFAGEIPQVGKPTKLKALKTVEKIRHRKDEKAPLAVVEEGKRDVVNEAFRVIRSNIDFMTGKNKGRADIIMLTSFNPGSGKSFVSYNLALSFSIKKKRVLLIDCDLRHGSSSMYVGLPPKGLVNYLTDMTDDWRSLIKKSGKSSSIDIMPIGKIPPNPAELLENGRLNKLISEAETEYDYMILDCPPVNIVVDTQIVGQLADHTLFVVRAGLLEKSALKELNEFYDEKKFKNMSVLLNGTTEAHSRYYTYGTYQNYND